jgi:hypothetical protein
MTVIERYPDLTIEELSTLVVAAAEVLMEAGETSEPVPDDLLEMSPGSLSGMIAESMPAGGPDRDEIARLLSNLDASQRLATGTLQTILESPDLRDAIGRRYEELERRMFVTESLLLSAALVVLAMRIRKVRIGRFNLDFYKSGEEVKVLVKGLTQGPIP